MDMISLDARKLITSNVHHIVHEIFKQPTTNIAIVLMQILIRLNPSLVRPLRRRTPGLLIGIIRVLMDTYLINLVLNRRFSVLEHVADTWGQSIVLVPVVYIAIVFVAVKSVRTDGKA